MNKLQKYVIFFKGRRTYQRNWRLIFRKKQLRKFHFFSRADSSDLSFSGVTDANRKRLRIASKSGTWKFSRVRGRSRWQRKYTAFFPASENGQNSRIGECSVGGIAPDITSMSVSMVRNVLYFPRSLRPNGLNMFTFKLSNISRFTGHRKFYDVSEKVSRAISIEVGGADSFQHFSQDCLPIICYCHKKGLLESDIKIILPEPLPGHSSVRWLLTNIFPDLEFKFVSKDETLLISELQIIQFEPRNYIFSLPQEMLRTMSDYLQNVIHESPSKKSFLFLHRGTQKMRNLVNLEDVEKTLRSIAAKFGLDYLLIDTSQTTISEIQKRLASARVVFGIHGGSMYNAMLAPLDAIVLEVVPTIDTNSLYNFFVDLGYNYVPIASEFPSGNKQFRLPPDELYMEVTSVLESYL